MIPGSANPLLLKSAAAAAGGYQVSRSLRFNSSDSAFCARTPAVAGNRRTWTWAGWVKRAALGSTQMLFGTTGTTDATYSEIFFTSADKLEVALGYTSVARIRTTQVFRDPSAWQHIVVAYDNTQATASNRLRLYVNGSEVTAFDTDTRSTFSNTDLGINSTQTHYIGIGPNSGSNYLSAYLTELHLIDGQQLTPSSFTEVSATTGQLIPLAYSGSFGTNGFWLKFSDNSAATAATLGKDYSGNSNNWTPNNLSVTAGAGNDSLVDTPTSFGTDTGVGGEVRGNYATLNPLDSKLNDNGTISNGNLQYAQSSTGARTGRASIGVLSGKWYWELTADNSGNSNVGVTNSLSNLGTYVGADANGWGYVAGGSKSNNGETAYGSSWTSGDIIGVALNMDAGTITFYKNNVSQGTAFSGLSGTLFPSVGTSNISTCSFTINFGQRAFAYTAPSGFKALCDTNLGAPVVAKPSTVFDVITYTGTGSSLTLPNGSSTPTSISFTPDFAWLKGRSGATNHALYDAVRGVQKDLVSNSTSAETTETTGLTAFGTNTFTVGSLAKLNTSSSTYVAWAWNAGGTTDPSNQAGSITSQVRANVSAGFSVVTWTGTGATTTRTIGHGLNVSLGMVIVKARDSGSNDMGWGVSHTSVAAPNYLYLNTTDAASNHGPAQGQPSIGSGSTFSILAGTAPGTNNFNANGIRYVAYCFSSVVGYSSFGAWVGSGTTNDGAFIYTGFRPRFILLKNSDNVEQWYIYDSARRTYNVQYPDPTELRPNSSAAEGSASLAVTLDFLSNGFKIRGNTGAEISFVGRNYIYAAFAESPFQYARAR